MQILNLNTKTIKKKKNISFITSNGFRDFVRLFLNANI